MRQRGTKGKRKFTPLTRRARTLLCLPVMDEYSPNPHLAIEPWIDAGAMRSWRHRGTSGVLVVCFRGLRLGAEDAQRPYEMPRAATGNGRHSTLFLTDAEESWLNAPGLIQAYAANIATVMTEERPARVVFLGNSMGGFSALVMAGILRADAVLAIAPQWSADPALVPAEKRWITQRSRIDEFTIRHAGDYLNPRCQNILLHSDAYAERFQRMPYLAVRGLENWIMTGMRHNIAQELRQAALLDRLVAAVADDDRAGQTAILSPLGKLHVAGRRGRRG